MRLTLTISTFLFLAFVACELPKPKPPQSKSECPVKIQSFCGISKIQSFITGLGYTTRPWKNDGVGWMFSTPYNEFGNQNPKTYMRNNIAFYGTSDNESFIKKMKLMLNLNNRNERKEGEALFLEHSIAILKELSIPTPENLDQSVHNRKPFRIENETCIIELTTEDGINTDEYTLSVESK